MQLMEEGKWSLLTFLTLDYAPDELPEQDHDDSMEIQPPEDQHQSDLTEALTKLRSELNTVNLME